MIFMMIWYFTNFFFFLIIIFQNLPLFQPWLTLVFFTTTAGAMWRRIRIVYMLPALYLTTVITVCLRFSGRHKASQVHTGKRTTTSTHVWHTDYGKQEMSYSIFVVKASGNQLHLPSSRYICSDYFYWLVTFFNDNKG